MGTFKEGLIRLFFVVITLTLASCGEGARIKKEIRIILDSANRIEAPLNIDIAFIDSVLGDRGYYFDTLTSDKKKVIYFENNGEFFAAERHIDSLLWDIYIYNDKGDIYQYYHQHINYDEIMGFDNARIGHTFEYENGKVVKAFKSYDDSNFSYNDLIRLLKDEAVDLMTTHIFTQFYQDENGEYYSTWQVFHDYYTPDSTYVTRSREFDMRTGKVIKDYY